MKTIYVLLTKYSDFISNFLYHFAGHGYTHASLGLGEDENRFYSFNYRGFCIETLEKHRKRGVNKSLCYQILVPESVYEDMKGRIREFEEREEEFQYTRIGALFAMLHIPFHWKKHYICSQFVAELLNGTGAVALQKDSSTYLPNQFRQELEHSPGLKQVIYDPL